MIQAEVATTETQKIVNEVLVRVDALAAKLGTTAEALWPAMVGAVRIQAMTALGVSLTVFLACLATVIANRKAIHDIEQDEETSRTVAFLAAALIGFVGMLATVLGASGWASNIAYPEAAAIQSLLGR